VNHIIEYRDVNFSYGEVPVLQDINLTIVAEEFFALIGPNAGGKSTLLKLLLGILKPDRGSIRVFGRPPSAAHTRIGYVPQFPTYRRDFPINVGDVVLMGRLGITSRYGAYSRQDRDGARAAMAALELEEISHKQVATLSGGQLQRMLIARALACEPEILILDEPTANIDIKAEEDIFALLKKYNERMTIIVVSHDVGFISAYVDRVGCLNRTLVCHNTEDISGRTIEELYGGPVRMIDHAHKH
jgi:zinc transport system ATP-binding protein